MKKFLTIMTAAAVLLCGLVLTGCGVKELVNSTYDTWYKYTGTINNINIPLGADAEAESVSAGGTTESASNYLQSVEFYAFFDSSSNKLKVAVQGSKDQNVTLFGLIDGGTVKVTAGGVKEFDNGAFSSATWLTLVGSGKFVCSNTPTIVANPDSCILLNDLTNFKIQWKKVLADILINQLLG